MTAKDHYFVVIIRIFFVLLSLKFIKDAFYKSDGYLYYLHFREFLPDILLAFIFWTILGVILASVFWLVTFGTHRILLKPLKSIRFEHIMIWFILLIVIYFFKQYFGIHLRNLSDATGLNRLIILIISGLLITAIVWLFRKYIERYTGKILFKLNTYIKPLVWIFVFLLILALPFSFPVFKRGMSESKKPDNNSHISYLKKKRPNILFVTWDAVIAKNLQVYGFNLPTTPFLLEWAKDAIVFKRAYSSSNWTTPTTMSMMTSQRPWTHKISHLFYLYPFRDYKDSLPAVLEHYGYATYAFVNNYNGHPDTLGLRNAFLKRDKYYTFWSIQEGLFGFKWRAKIFIEKITNSPITAKWTLEHPLFIPLRFIVSDTDKTMVPVENVYDRFLEFISQKHLKNTSQQPFFTWIHVEPPHLPFLSPKPYMGMFGDAERFNTYNKQEYLFGLRYPPEMEKDVEILRKRYYEYILYCDQEFKSFISHLNKIIDMSNTIIIFSADHGTSLSRGFIGHGDPELWEFLVHIPLIMKIPGEGDGKIIDMLVEQIDIAPTILEFADIPAPAWMEGRSLVPLIEGKSLTPRPIFTMQLEYSRLIENSQFNKFSVAVWDGDYKLIYYPGWKDNEKETLLFNLRSDPDEEKNIYHENPEVTLKLMKLIEDNLLIAKKRLTQ